MSYETNETSTTEQYHPLNFFLGQLAKRPHPSTAIRWATKGVRLPDGRRLRLQATRIGCGWFVTPTAWETFLQEQTAAHTQADATPAPVRSPSARRKASEAAERELERLGV